jgi:hypothetical protein
VEPPRLRCVVVVPGGPSRRVGPNGILIGRQGDCDIVAADPQVSRRHALIRLTSEGAEVVPLGRHPLDLNGTESSLPVALAHGDVLRLPGLELRIDIAIPKPERDAPAGFVLERAIAKEKAPPAGSALDPGGGGFRISHTPFTLGGGDTDDLIVKGWPVSAIVFHLAQGELFVEPRADTAERSGQTLAPETLEPLVVGDTLAYRGEAFTIALAPGRVATTAVGSKTELPTRVEIEMLPRGGRVIFTVGAREHAVYLADRRFDLLVALLRPPAGYIAGAFIPDDTVRAIVWPRKPEVSRQEINMLISRCRRDLVDVGLAGPRLLERAPGGGGTRIALADGAVVGLRS